jgi:hypothetical protein
MPVSHISSRATTPTMLESRRINERRPEIGAESRPIAFRKRGFCFPLSDAGNRWAGERQKFLIALLHLLSSGQHFAVYFKP